ncbi:MAG: cation transporting ATPase C-terminal domain-containing protein, partial [Candidatus Nanoarchaeia archaeon]|nr:cation transporting ATPase C-terminal domain-containing protein [Candidatus Nanoarchaeia archaeon]
EVSLILFTALFGLLTPLTAIMILFINIVTSTLPAMALSIEPTHPKVMNQRPRNSKEGLLSRYVLLKIFSLIPILFVGTLALFLWEINIAGMDLNKARTMAFATIIMFELFHTFNSRSLHSTIFNKTFFNNKYIFVAVGLSVILTLLTIHTGVGQVLFGTVGLTGFDWIIIFAVSSSVVFVAELIKALVNSELKEQHSLNSKAQIQTN